MWWLSFLFMWENWSNDSPVWGCLWWPLYDAWPMEQPRSAALWPRRLLTESIKACGAESWKPIGREEGVAWFEFCSAAPAPIHTRTAWLLTPAFTCCTTLQSCISFYPLFPIYMYQLSSNNWHFSSIKKVLYNLNGPARGFWLVET